MKSLEIVNENLDYLEISNEPSSAMDKEDLQTIKQSLEVLEIMLTNCENEFLDVLNECLIMGTPIHTEKLQKLSGYINKILIIKKQWLEENEND